MSSEARTDPRFQSLLRRMNFLEQALRVDLGGGAILAHNVLSHGSEMEDFLEVIQDHPDLETWIERRSRAGISVSIKRRQSTHG